MDSTNGMSLSNARTTPRSTADPFWSPDGAQIAFTTNREGLADEELYAKNANGTEALSAHLRPGSGGNSANRPAKGTWGPDGLKVAFHAVGDGDSEIYATPPNGAVHQADEQHVQRRIARLAARLSRLSRLSPAQGSNPHQGLARAGLQRMHACDRQPGARPASCASSCNASNPDVSGIPPAQTPASGRGIARPRQGRRSGRARGVPDDSRQHRDAGGRSRRRHHGEHHGRTRKSDLGDYAGELQVKSVVRIVDRLNGPGAIPGAVATSPRVHGALGDCSPTPADVTIGSNCSLNTTADAITPGLSARASARSGSSARPRCTTAARTAT